MSLEEYAQLSVSDSESSFHCNNWAMRRTTRESAYKYNNNPKNMNLIDPTTTSNKHYHREKLCTSYSTPTTSTIQSHKIIEDEKEQNQFLREIGQVRQGIRRFRDEMNGLAKQMGGMEIDLNQSKDRVREIEIGLIATQEVNVNLQVLLEKAVHKQKESDVYATRAMRHIHTDLASIVYETTQLKGRLNTIANYQRQHQGSVTDVAERMREYTHMLEQAQGTIQSLQKEEPNTRQKMLLSPEDEEVLNSLDILNHHYSTDEDDDSEEEKASTTSSKNIISSNSNLDLYRHRIIRKRASNPEVSLGVGLTQQGSWLPQKGLRILLNDYQGL